MQTKVIQLLAKIKELKTNISQDNRLPSNTYYLNDEEILCTNENTSDIRYPYDMDGMNLWVHSNGHIDACEGILTIIKTMFFNNNSSVDFWGGVLLDSGEWFPVSILGANKQLFEPFQVERYTVFCRREAYFIADTEKHTFAVRANITSKKQINFSVCIIPKTNQTTSVYVASFIEYMLRNTNNLDIWDMISRYGNKIDQDTYRFCTDEGEKHIAIIKRTINSKVSPIIESTVSKLDFVGNSSFNITNSSSLKNGCFLKNVTGMNTIDIPILGEIIKFETNDIVLVNYLTSFAVDDSEANRFINESTTLEEIETDIINQNALEKERLSKMEINFTNISLPNINDKIWNRFIRNVQKQVDLCALGKNYVGKYIGIRDVFQQLDTSVFWDPVTTREKILLSLNYIFSNGRAPRQFSINHAKNEQPDMDIREFIDQGTWIINTIYNYISVTNDYTILNELCSYYNMLDEQNCIWAKGETTSVLEHLTRITDYLLSNIDEETGCLKINFGDWNDSLNGLGKSLDSSKKFGSGVSIMASLQLYKNLQQMAEIITESCGESALSMKYCACAEKLKGALLENALVESDDHGTHIIHGWGDKSSYKICTPKDYDGNARYSAIVYAFWCISGMIESTPWLKDNIMNVFELLDSKYGIRTFFPGFDRNSEKYIGRLAIITPGTYENTCTYVHSTMFSVMAMFILGKGKEAWEQIRKVIPITHEFTSKTPFVMPNSYCYNEEYCLDGESAGDWYTGSGCVLIRNIIKHIFGIQPNLKGIRICTASYVPVQEMKASMEIKGSKISLLYKKTGDGQRKYYINGKLQTANFNKLSENWEIFIDNDDMKEDLLIEVFN